MTEPPTIIWTAARADYPGHPIHVELFASNHPAIETHLSPPAALGLVQQVLSDLKAADDQRRVDSSAWPPTHSRPARWRTS
jgi:hypothetical protein